MCHRSRTEPAVGISDRFSEISRYCEPLVLLRCLRNGCGLPCLHIASGFQNGIVSLVRICFIDVFDLTLVFTWQIIWQWSCPPALTKYFPLPQLTNCRGKASDSFAEAYPLGVGYSADTCCN